jgi:hypothetical protein
MIVDCQLSIFEVQRYNISLYQPTVEQREIRLRRTSSQLTIFNQSAYSSILKIPNFAHRKVV